MKNSSPKHNEQSIIESIQTWLTDIVIKLNLCPFAKRELVNHRIRYKVASATDTEELLVQLQRELKWLENNSEIETSLLIHPYVLNDFERYNDFLNDCDDLLDQLEFDGVFQIASFHPSYQFSGTSQDDAENYTNRSPFPILHILREDSLEAAIANYPDVNNIPLSNIAMMNELGREKLAKMLAACHKEAN